MASIEDAAECGERADALVSGVLGRIMAQRRSVAAAMDYIRGLSRETRANCWELAEKAGHEGPHRMQALLSRWKWPWEKAREELPGLARGVPARRTRMTRSARDSRSMRPLTCGKGTPPRASRRSMPELPGRWRTA